MRHPETKAKNPTNPSAAAYGVVPVSAIASQDIVELIARGRRLRAQFVHDQLIRAVRACARAFRHTLRAAKARTGTGQTVTG